MEIITLVENSCFDGRLQEEFGLSLLITSKSQKILFDMGASSLFIKNAAILEESVEDVDYAIISHAHYDHGGGLAAFLEANATAQVYLGKNGKGDYFGNTGAKLQVLPQPHFDSAEKNDRLLPYRYVGLDKSVLQAHPERLTTVQDQLRLTDDICLITELADEYPLAEGNKSLFEKKGDILTQDSFDHELIMIIRENDGLVLFTGCGHSGILNMLSTVNRLFQGEKINAVIGGFHLALRPGKPQIAGSEKDIIAIAEKFKDLGIKKVISGHCTGEDACTILHDQLGDRFECFSTGSRHVV